MVTAAKLVVHIKQVSSHQVSLFSMASAMMSMTRRILPGLMESQSPSDQPHTEVAASGMKTPGLAPKTLQIYPEMDLAVMIDDRRNRDSPKQIRITGKADWALGRLAIKQSRLIV